MLMVIFGAGASHDSIAKYPSGKGIDDRPPLTDQILESSFGESIRRYPAFQELVPELRNREDSQSLEEKLEEINAELISGADPHRASQLAAVRFYLRHLIAKCDRTWPDRGDQVTNYVTLLNRLRRWALKTGESLCLVTFNYDLMLDRACETPFGIRIDELDTYTVNDRVTVVKFHGSINWGHPIENGAEVFQGRVPSENQIIARFAELRLLDEIKPFAWLGMPNYYGNQWNDGRLGVPALSVPIQQKAKHECPDDQLKALDVAIKQTSRLLVVGWKGAEQHFWDRWKGNVGQVKVLIVGSAKSPRPIMSRSRLADGLTSVGIAGPFNTASVGFSAILGEHRAELEALLA